MSLGKGALLGLGAFPAGVAVAATLAAGVNLYYRPHPVYFVGTAIALPVAWALGRTSLRAFGLREVTAKWLPLAVAALVAGGFVLVTWLSFPNGDAAARRHRPVLQQLPVYPGSAFRSERVSGGLPDDEDAEEGFLNPPHEFFTSWTWTAPARTTTEEIASWYQKRLTRDGWVPEVNVVGDGSIQLFVQRGKVSVGITVFPRRRTTPLEPQVASLAAGIEATAG